MVKVPLSSPPASPLTPSPNIPVDRPGQPLLKGNLWPPVQLGADLARIDRIPPVVPLAIRRAGDEPFVNVLVAMLVQVGDHLSHQRAVFPLIFRPDEIDLAHAPAFCRRAKRRSELLYLMAKQPNIQPERLSSIKCPVLVIAGTQDVIKEKHTKLIAASLPDSSLCFLKGGHSIAKTNSVEFNSAVEKFLNSL